MASVCAWLFEAESIQSFIHDSGRLLDAVGASLLVDELCGSLDAQETSSDLLSGVLRATQTGPQEVRFSRRGGGAFIAFFDDAQRLARVRALWSVAIADYAPGLRWSDTVAAAESPWEAARAGMSQLRQARLTASPTLPEAGPMVQLAPRSGRPAVGLAWIGPTRELSDASSLAKRKAARTTAGVAARFSTREGLDWPTRLDLGDTKPGGFPFLPGQNEVVYLHADGNGLGVALQALAKSCESTPEKYIATYAAFSQAVSRATQTAAQRATELVLRPDEDQRVPARPLVLGGDDLSIILRPDVALPFATAFMAEFEVQTRQELSRVWPKGETPPGVPSVLTAACGMVVVNASYPFIRAAELASDMCDQVKRAIKGESQRTGAPLPSALMFCRVTASLGSGSDGDVLPSVPGTQGQLRLVGGPYVLEQGGSSLPGLQALRTLSEQLGADEAARGPARQMLTLLYESPALAQQTWSNWRRSLKREAPERLKALDSALGALSVVASEVDLPFTPKDSEGVRRTPLADAQVLRDMELTP